MRLTVLFVELAGAACCAAAVHTIPGDSELISWGGRTVLDVTGGAGRSFDWLGVQARLAVYNATWLAVTASATGSQGRGTRLRAYFRESGYDCEPPLGSSPRRETVTEQEENNSVRILYSQLTTDNPLNGFQ